VISINRSLDWLIDWSISHSIAGFDPQCVGLMFSCVPAPDIAGHRVSSCSYRFLDEAEEQMARFDTPRVWLFESTWVWLFVLRVPFKSIH
jgi:hypothetical protein